MTACPCSLLVDGDKGIEIVYTVQYLHVNLYPKKDITKGNLKANILYGCG